MVYKSKAKLWLKVLFVLKPLPVSHIPSLRFVSFFVAAFGVLSAQFAENELHVVGALGVALLWFG